VSGAFPNHWVNPFELIGKQLMGRYTIQARLARGGMSVVYRGEDDRLRRPVCIKVFFGIDPARPSYETVYQHFVQEAFTLSKLQHPNTIRIYDFGYLEVEPHSPFHVSELMEGGTLTGYMRGMRRLSTAQAIEIIEPIVGALAEAHAAGVVHRDIKPTNILFGKGGGSRPIVKLADFSIAKIDVASNIPNRADDTATGTGEQVPLYSIGWAAPEQLRCREVGPTADVYALGLMVAYMLSGTEIYPETDMMQTFDMRMQGDLYLQRAVRDLGLGPAQTDVILQACRTRPEERYEGVEELLTALRNTSSLRAKWDDDDVTARGNPDRDIDTDPDQGGGAAPAPQRIEAPLSSETRVPAVDRFGEPTTQRNRFPILLLSSASFSEREVHTPGGRLRLFASEEPIVIGTRDEGAALESAARVRLTIVPSRDGAVRLNAKGLNCFVRREGGRPSAAVDLGEDGEVELVAADRRVLDRMRIRFGAVINDVRVFALDGPIVGIPPDGPPAVLIDLGPGRELALLYRLARNPTS